VCLRARAPCPLRVFCPGADRASAQPSCELSPSVPWSGSRQTAGSGATCGSLGQDKTTIRLFNIHIHIHTHTHTHTHTLTHTHTHTHTHTFDNTQTHKAKFWKESLPIGVWSQHFDSTQAHVCYVVLTFLCVENQSLLCVSQTYAQGSLTPHTHTHSLSLSLSLSLTHTHTHTHTQINACLA